MTPLLPITYFGNLEYYWYLTHYKTVLVDIDEIYQKQTYRNRATVMGANGMLNLTVPVERPFGSKTRTKEVLIANTENWQNLHWKTLKSCYNRTPYFEFYADQIREILFHPHTYLYELNQALTKHIAGKIGLISELKIQKDDQSDQVQDKKKDFTPKTISTFISHKYLQTFTERFGFVENLSILDLLFNEGPNAICILNESKMKKTSKKPLGNV